MNNERKTVRLYHFTSTRYISSIAERQALLPSESNIGSPTEGFEPFGEHYAPDVVWLTNKQYNDGTLGLEGSALDKGAVRYTVEIPDDEAHHWPEWSRKHGMNETWRRAFEGTGDPDSWYVVERPISRKEFVAVEILPNKDAAYV